MADYQSTHTGQEIDESVTKVLNGTSGIQGVKVNGTEVETDSENKVAITIPTVSQSTGDSTTEIMSQNAVTTELNNKATTSLYNATLSSSGWSSGDAPYTQTVSVQGILSTDTPIVDVVLSSTTSTALSQLEAWGYISKIDTSNDQITATCLESKPSIGINIQLIVVR